MAEKKPIGVYVIGYFLIFVGVDQFLHEVFTQNTEIFQILPIMLIVLVGIGLLMFNNGIRIIAIIVLVAHLGAQRSLPKIGAYGLSYYRLGGIDGTYNDLYHLILDNLIVIGIVFYLINSKVKEHFEKKAKVRNNT